MGVISGSLELALSLVGVCLARFVLSRILNFLGIRYEDAKSHSKASLGSVRFFVIPPTFARALFA